MDHLCHLCLVFVMLPGCLLPAGKRLSSWLLFMMCNCIFVPFSCGILGQVWYLLYGFLIFAVFVALNNEYFMSVGM